MSLSFVPGTFAAALIGSAVGIFAILPLGLIAPQFVIVPLALGVAAIIASVCAAWAGNFLAGNGTSTRLLQVVGAMEGVAAIVSVLLLVASYLRLALAGPLIFVAVACVLTLAIAASAATWRFRTTRRAARDGLLSLGLLALAVVSVPVVIWIASLAGLTGA